MDRTTERQLTRWLTGDLDGEEARRLERRLAAEPELAREAERLRRAWAALEVPAGIGAGEAAVPPGFSGRVMARVREEAETPSLSWRAAPALVRVAGAAALVTGLLLGVALGGPEPAPPPAVEPTSAVDGGSGGEVTGGDPGQVAERPAPETAGGPAAERPAGPAFDPVVEPAADPDAAVQVADAADPGEGGEAGSDDWSAVYADDAFGLDNLGDAYADALSSWGEEGT